MQAYTQNQPSVFIACWPKRFPFAIYYELTKDIATVVAVLDCRQNPISINKRLV